jgi:S-ribosylhomocysteine lyase LuxS involved in autoinducer biosynthesis
MDISMGELVKIVDDACESRKEDLEKICDSITEEVIKNLHNKNVPIYQQCDCGKGHQESWEWIMARQRMEERINSIIILNSLFKSYFKIAGINLNNEE